MSSLLAVLLPERCSVCGAGESALCEGCSSSLVRLRPPLCRRCGAPTAWPVARCSECAGRRLSFASARAGVAYRGPARALVAAWKERGLRSLGRTLALLVVEVVACPRADVLTFVPGDPGRTLWRGVNAAESLARELGAAWELPVAPLLARERPVRRQRGLSRRARRANVRGAFRSAAGAPVRVVLVDDVYTTGATVGAAASELKRAGASHVDVVTFARAVRAAA